jgi:hypothetical protein
MSIQAAAADLASRIPAMAQDSPLNCQGVIANLMEQAVKEEVSRQTSEMEQMFYTLGWCIKCNSEIQYDITEPFVSCQCPDGFGEASKVPVISGLRHELFVYQMALEAALAELMDAATGYAPYPWNHEDNPVHATIIKVRRALRIPEVPIQKTNTKPS